jgi:S1-C subfamily serine protease
LVVQADEFGVSRRTPVQTPKQSSQQVLPYVARIIAFDSSGQSFGTGSYIGTYGEYGVVLTNQHVVCEMEEDRLVHVHFPSGFSSYGAIVQTDPKWDLALIAISKPPLSVPTLAVAQAPSKPGDPLWIVGFGSGSYREAEGRCVRYMPLENPKDGIAQLNEIMEVSVSARKGDSGGPILNQKGELAGVLFGSDLIRNTAGSYCGRVNRFLSETQDRMVGLPSRPETHFAAIEKNGPVRSLSESRNATPPVTTTPQQPVFFGSSASSFGVPSTSRRYVPPVLNEPRVQ